MLINNKMDKEEIIEQTEKPVEQAAAAEETSTPSAREKFLSRISAINPDEKIEDEDAHYERALSYLEQLESETAKRRDADKKLLDVLRSEPELEGITRAVMKGVPTRAAIAKYFDPQDLVPQEGEDDLDAYKQYAQERRQRLEEREKFEKEVEENLSKSEAILVEFTKEHNLDDTKKVELIDTVSSMMDDLYKGILPKELLDHVMRSKMKDIEVSKAFEQGEIKGKNEKIEEKKIIAKKTGDNIPVFNGGKTEEIKEEAPKKSRLDRLVERENRKVFR